MKLTQTCVIGLAAILAGGSLPASAQKKPASPALQQFRDSRWTPQEAWKWYQGVGPICGFNYVPRTAVNTTEMWQKETFDPRTIDEELGWAERCGLTSARVFVQYVVYEADPQGLIGRMERFLEIADKHRISVMFILFDDCFIPEPKLGKQPNPVPGVHNSQWTASPGDRRKRPENWPALEKYVKDVVGHFADDTRIVAWDLYNEAAAPSRPLVEASFAWARAARPSQPLTSCWQASDLSDVISFHDYGPPNARQLDQWIAQRPALCTECIARGAGSRLDNVLPALAQRGIGWYMWGLVKGRIQTYYPWGSPKGAAEPKLWHHDLLQPDGTPYRPEEIAQICRFPMEFNAAKVAGTLRVPSALIVARSGAASPARNADRVLVVRNDNSPISRAVADDYAKRRAVGNVLSVRCQDSAASAANETISYAAYREAIEKPLRAFLAAHPSIDFIVLTKGIPLRIPDAPGRGLGDHCPSLDSYLAALDYDKVSGAKSVRLNDSGFTGTAWANRFWNSSAPFTHVKFGGYLVTRLDAYTEADAKALTTRALAAEQAAGKSAADGKILLDTCPAFGYADRKNQPRPVTSDSGELNYNEYNADMQRAADILCARNVPVELTQTDVFAGKRSGLLGYVSWGSNDRHYDAQAYHSLRFAPGAICETAVSTSARTFLPTQGGQSLIADLITQGVTGAKGYTDEPLLQAVASPSILLDRYARGWTLAESYYAASRFVGWEDIVIGDPLCRIQAGNGSAGLASTAAGNGQGLTLGSADTMEKVFRDEPWNRPAVVRLAIEAARNEVEGVQLVVAAGKEDVCGAMLEVSDLAGDAGSKIPKANVTWNIVGYVETEKPAYPVSKVGWWPDPLLSAGKFDVHAGRVQPLWINVRVPQDARPGLYRGTISLRLADNQVRSVSLEVRVWNFAIPKQQHLETCFLLRPEELQKFYKLPAVPIEMYEQWLDFCLDHRISLMLCEWPGFNTDMERLVARQLDRGGSAFCLANAWFEHGPPEARRKHNAEQIAQIRPLYERAKKRGWIDRAYIYCFDEIGREQYPFALELYREMKKSMPDLRLMQTFYKDDPMPVLGEVMDIWAPNTGRYHQAEFQAEQAKGKTVWWYVCCGPVRPYANLMIEWPAIDHRVLLWQNQKYRVTGFLYWGLNTWRDNLVGEKRWPEVKWKPATWRNDAGAAHNGDGQLIYPGSNRQPLSSIRLENFRDGAEDYEYFWLLQDAVARLKKADPVKHQALIAEAQQILAVDDAVVKDLTHFTRDSQALRQARAKIARLIEKANQATR
jgi:uncharacterized protein (TIGR03790 family)